MRQSARSTPKLLSERCPTTHKFSLLYLSFFPSLSFSFSVSLSLFFFTLSLSLSIFPPFLLIAKLLYNYKCLSICPYVSYVWGKTQFSQPLSKIEVLFLCAHFSYIRASVLQIFRRSVGLATKGRLFIHDKFESEV